MSNKEISIDNLIEPRHDMLESENNLTDDMRLSVINNLLDTDKNKKVNSRIYREQVSKITRLYTFAEIFNNDLVKNIADNVLLLQISIYGLGRKELVRILQSTSEMSQEDQPKRRLRDVFRW